MFRCIFEMLSRQKKWDLWNAMHLAVILMSFDKKGNIIRRALINACCGCTLCIRFISTDLLGAAEGIFIRSFIFFYIVCFGRNLLNLHKNMFRWKMCEMLRFDWHQQLNCVVAKLFWHNVRTAIGLTSPTQNIKWMNIFTHAIFHATHSVFI